MIRLIFRKVLFMIVWAYLIVIPIYAQAMEPVVAARAGIIWIALALAMMYEFRTANYPDVKCWGNICEWGFFKKTQ